MKLNVSFPATGAQKTFEIPSDDHKLRHFYDKRMGTEIAADHLGDEWKGYILKIAGGNDKQGFPMKQGVLTNTRVRLLLKKGHSCYRPRRAGERKRKSVRGCIVDQNLSALALIIVRKGEGEIPGLTDVNVPRRLGPKRASNIRKLFNLTKEDDVREFVVKRALPTKEGKKPRFKSPKIQRLITPVVLQRKRHRLLIKKRRSEARREAEVQYSRLVGMRRRQERVRRTSRLSSIRDSRSSLTSEKDKKSLAVAKKKEAATKKEAIAPKKEAAPAKKVAAKKDAAGKKAATKKDASKKDASKKEVKKDGKKEVKKDATKKDAPKKDAKKEVKKEAPKKEAKKEVKKEEKKPAAAAATTAKKGAAKPAEAKKAAAPKTEGKKPAAAPASEKKPAAKKEAAPAAAAAKKEAPKRKPEPAQQKSEASAAKKEKKQQQPKKK